MHFLFPLRATEERTFSLHNAKQKTCIVRTIPNEWSEEKGFEVRQGVQLFSSISGGVIRAWLNSNFLEWSWDCRRPPWIFAGFLLWCLIFFWYFRLGNPRLVGQFLSTSDTWLWTSTACFSSLVILEPMDNPPMSWILDKSNAHRRHVSSLLLDQETCACSSYAAYFKCAKGQSTSNMGHKP